MSKKGEELPVGDKSKTNKKTIIVFILTLVLLSVISFFFLTLFNEKNSSQLVNTTWKVEQFNGEEINEQILFSIDSDSVGFTICNNIGYGKIKITKEKIYFHSEASSTMMACDEPLMSLESSFVNIFSEPFNYVIENEKLILQNGRDVVLLAPYDSSFDVVSGSGMLSIEEVQAMHEPLIMNVPGVVGVGIGECNGQPCLKILLEKETPESKDIPIEIEGFKVEKEITGLIEILPEKDEAIELDLQRREAIQEAYPEFVVDYEEQPCFAGCSVNIIEENRDYYFAYITHASGVPIGVATCFRVDPTMKVYKVGEFPDMTDSYIGYKDVDPKTCKGIK